VTEKTIAASIHIDETRTSPERGLFTYGNDTIHYDVIRKTQHMDGAKRPRKITIKVRPDRRVSAIAPFDATEQTIEQAMLKRARWIWQNLNDFSKQKESVLDKTYVSGETQFYLGRRYVLKIIVDAEQSPNVKLIHGKLNVVIKHELNTDGNERSIKIKPLIHKWYQHKAKAIFHERLTELLPKTTWVKSMPDFRVMAMKKQWGSCSTKGNLMLNPHLVKAPKECIDYVILHELCHIAEHNHSERFWRLLTQVMPNWKEVKATLDDMAEMYLNE
jgi:predicted metal-dependent hydrolase